MESSASKPRGAAPPLPSWAVGTGQLVAFPTAADAPARSGALPPALEGWTGAEHAGVAEAWRLQVELAAGLPCRDERHIFRDLVGSNDLASHSVHRWYSYKEAYSPRLPVEVVGRLGAGGSGVVADPFAGVATSVLALQHHPQVNRVIGVEYSPFAHFVGQAKLGWSKVPPRKLRDHIDRLRDYPLDPELPVPQLAAFSNAEIFKPSAVTSLVSAHAAIRADDRLSHAERRLLLLGLAAIVEDVSGVMKDGRALRILRGRSRRPKALRPQRGAVANDGVQSSLVNQWLAMVEDLENLAPFRAAAKRRRDAHLRGDARDLGAAARRSRLKGVLDASSVGLCVYSPPYLNCIDYTEVYKLELWLLGFVTDQIGFRDVRLGTLRSHPSIKFDRTEHLVSVEAPVAEAIEHIAETLESELPRPGLGDMARNYFEDMYQVFIEQHRILEPGGHSVCVVANSTFSRRRRDDDGMSEAWRLPLLTDVILARLAQAAGFEHVEVWEARDLVARNVRQGSARESLVIARKAA